MTAGPPPVGRANAAEQNSGLSVPAQNYLTIVDTLKANNGAEAKAIRAMFGGDKRLMDSFLATVFNLLQSNPRILSDCDPMSLVQCVKDAASLGLVPMTDDAAIVPYGRKATLLPMWRGYVKRIRNSRQVTDLDVQVVYLNDEFDLRLGTDPSLHHVPKLYGEKDPSGEYVDERGDYRGVYAWALMPSGKYIIEWMTADDINHVRDTWGNKTSRDGKPLPWQTSWSEMGRKTVIRRLAKRLPAAAVDKLLELDRAADAAQGELADSVRKLDSGLSEVRQLALRAVGEEPPTTDNAEPSKPAEPTEEPPPEDGGQGDGSGSAPVPAKPKPDAGAPGAVVAPLPPQPRPPAVASSGVARTDPLTSAIKFAEEQDKAQQR